MVRTSRLSEFAKEAERALQLAVADAIEEHRHAGKPVVVARKGRPVLVQAEKVRTVRETSPVYGTAHRLNPRIKRVHPEANYRLRLTFSNGEVRVFDVKPLLGKGVFRELRDESRFRAVRPWLGTIQWKGGQDICPDTLYEDSIPVGEAQPAAVREAKAPYRTRRPRKT